jgi:hypothetical protein
MRQPTPAPADASGFLSIVLVDGNEEAPTMRHMLLSSLRAARAGLPALSSDAHGSVMNCPPRRPRIGCAIRRSCAAETNQAAGPTAEPALLLG